MIDGAPQIYSNSCLWAFLPQVLIRCAVPFLSLTHSHYLLPHRRSNPIRNFTTLDPCLVAQPPHSAISVQHIHFLRPRPQISFRTKELPWHVGGGEVNMVSSHSPFHRW